MSLSLLWTFCTLVVTLPLRSFGEGRLSLNLLCTRDCGPLFAVCGSSGELFPLAPGRSGPELGAALMQLERFIDSEPVFQGGYLDGPVRFREDPDLFPRDEFPQLFPYRSLDSARLKLVGQGAWPMEKFIEGPLWLPFQEPAILRHGLEVDFSAAPNFKKESRDECLRLVKLWDSKGLVRLFEEPAEPGCFVGFSRLQES